MFSSLETIHTFVTFVIVNTIKMLHTEFCGYFQYVRINIHMSNSSSSLVLAIDRKTKYRFRSAAMLLFYILQNPVLTKADSFIEIYHHTLLPL
jgi:hypothetical protein